MHLATQIGHGNHPSLKGPDIHLAFFVPACTCFKCVRQESCHLRLCSPHPALKPNERLKSCNHAISIEMTLTMVDNSLKILKINISD